MVDFVMDGIRSWKFEVAGFGDVELLATDFWLDYDGTVQGTGTAERRVTLQSVWQHSDLDLAKGLARRAFMEARFRDLNWNFVGKLGTLTIDEGLPEEVIETDITLLSVEPVQADHNELIEYTMVFGFPLTSAAGTGGLEVARYLGFETNPHNLVPRSNAFDLWTVQNGVTAGADTDANPEDGTVDADTLTDDGNSGTGAAFINIASGSILDQAAHVVGVRVKKGTNTAFTLELQQRTPNLVIARVNFDFSGAVPTIKANDILTGDVLLTTDDEWFLARVIIPIDTIDGTKIHRLYVYPSEKGETESGTLIVWGAQMQRGTIMFLPVGTTASVVDPDADLPLGKEVSAVNYVVVFGEQDRTQFKPVFRAAPIRVPSGASLRTIDIEGVVKALAFTTDLETREAAEQEIQDWSALINNKGTLQFNEERQTDDHHLASVSPFELELADRVTYGLAFVAGFVE